MRLLVIFITGPLYIGEKMTRTLLICYDIEKDRDRNDLIELLQYFHLARVQYSLFFGVIPDKEYRELIRRIRSEFTRDSIKILIMEMCERCMERVILIQEELPKPLTDFMIL